MNKRTDIDQKISEALESLDGIRRAEPAPYFYTRVRASLERDDRNIWEVAGSFMSRPVIAFAGLLLILCINAFVLLEKGKASDPSAAYSPAVPVEEYVLTDVNSNYYENIEP